MEPGQKKSVAVPLVLMGAVAGAMTLPALFSGTDVQRNRYASRQACVEDYSDAQCGPDLPLSGSGSGGAGTFYYGPWYRSDYRSRANDANDPGPGRAFRNGTTSGFSSAGTDAHGPAGVETGTRGGFGRSGRVSARGG